jgi:N-acetyl-gamma-glutamylphosphate reductase
LTTLYVTPAAHLENENQIARCYQEAYGQEPFVRLLEGSALPDTKNVSKSPGVWTRAPGG